MPNTFTIVIALNLLLPTSPLHAQSPAPLSTPSEPQTTGQIKLTFEHPGPQSAFKAQSRRFRNGIPPGTPPYVTSFQTFHAYVPPDYDGSQPYGLIVYVSPSDQPMFPRRGWTDVFDRHKLIFICAENTGNKQHVLHRFAAALDAVHHVPLKYNIDPDRRYVSGMSGGGRCASMLALGYPDLFTGAMPFCGVNYYRNVPVPDQPGRLWRASFQTPSTALVGRSRLHSRFVLVTGSEDFNREETRATYELMKQHRFKQVHYVEVPGMKHANPNAEWLEKIILQLDEPLKNKP